MARNFSRFVAQCSSRTVLHVSAWKQVVQSTLLLSILPIQALVLKMSSETVEKMPFRKLPGRPKVTLPKWPLPPPEEEVKYVLKKCRGVMQNCFHDVSDGLVRFCCTMWNSLY